MGFSIYAQAVVLLCLLVALVVLVVGQVAVEWAWPEPANPTERDRWKWVIWAAFPAALGGAVVGGIAGGLLALLIPSPFSGAVAVVWLIAGALIPCAILGYLSGRWWSFVGAAPILLLWPIGVAFGSTTDATLNEDLFSTLPLTAAIAVELSLGSGAFLLNRRWPVSTHRAKPAASAAPGVGVPKPPAFQRDITPMSSVSEQPPNQPPFWPPPPNWKPAPTPAAEQPSVSEPLPPDQPPFWPPPPNWKPAPTPAAEQPPGDESRPPDERGELAAVDGTRGR